VNVWPALPLAEWRETYATLHLWSQVVGKIRLACAPPVNHWWHVTLYVTARGLTTSSMPHGSRAFQIDFDFIDHRLMIETSDGGVRAIALEPMSVAEFYRAVMAGLDELAVPVRIWPRPVEIPDPIVPFPEDDVHASYDPDYVHRCWQIVAESDAVLTEFRGRFLGKASPSHFFWGGFDLAATRFSGRPAPPHPGGIPNVGDWVNRESYSHELWSAGWWPGSGAIDEPAYYAYAYPEPSGFREARVEPAEAYFHPEMGLFALPYEAVRQARDPRRMLTSFLESTYAAAAESAGWDRAALER
jgi:hypothetical protein